MRLNTNAWNRIRYTLWAPIYDLVLWPMRGMRRRSIAALDLRPGERVLLLGAGTGLDLGFLPRAVQVTAVDITPAMILALRWRAARLRRAVDARVMDAQALEFQDAAFDAVVLHLIVAVIPDPVRCVREAARVLRPGGRAVIFDKFLPDGARPAWPLRLLNLIPNLIASDMTRQLGPIVAGSGLRVVRDEPAALGGYLRIVLLSKDP